MDAISLLREDHIAVLAMLDELETVPGDGRPATPDDVPARRQLVTALVMAESAHEALEEEYFWPSVRRWLSEGNELAEPAVAQEQSAKQLLAELDKLKAGEARFERLVSQVITDAREHISYEETHVWPVVRRRVSAAALEELGEKIAAARKVAPTRPHPHTPPKPQVLKAVGPAAAAADHLRDAVTHREPGEVPTPSGPIHEPALAPPSERITAPERTPVEAEPSRSRPNLPLRILVGALTLVLVVAAVRRRRGRHGR